MPLPEKRFDDYTSMSHRCVRGYFGHFHAKGGERMESSAETVKFALIRELWHPVGFCDTMLGIG